MEGTLRFVGTTFATVLAAPTNASSGPVVEVGGLYSASFGWGWAGFVLAAGAGTGATGAG